VALLTPAKVIPLIHRAISKSTAPKHSSHDSWTGPEPGNIANKIQRRMVYIDQKAAKNKDKRSRREARKKEAEESEEPVVSCGTAPTMLQETNRLRMSEPNALS
jgi:hypothetical protein